jgi:predicted RNase H-like nuclease (RuvC/YqgF family)
MTAEISMTPEGEIEKLIKKNSLCPRKEKCKMCEPAYELFDKLEADRAKMEAEHKRLKTKIEELTKELTEQHVFKKDLKQADAKIERLQREIGDRAMIKAEQFNKLDNEMDMLKANSLTAEDVNKFRNWLRFSESHLLTRDNIIRVFDNIKQRNEPLRGKLEALAKGKGGTG